jgi:tRNA dimethylallyltransferase
MEVRALHARLGGGAFRQALAARDPVAAERLAPGDSQRLIRAYEVVTATGRTLGDWRRGQGAADMPAAAVLLLPPRAQLYAACDGRFSRMMEEGAIAEVEALLERGLDPTLPAMKALGVSELAALIAGRVSREAAVAAAQQATRRYAKRQYTWFRHQMPERGGLRKLVIGEQFSERLVPEILSFIRQSLLTIKQ